MLDIGWTGKSISDQRGELVETNEERDEGLIPREQEVCRKYGIEYYPGCLIGLEQRVDVEEHCRIDLLWIGLHSRWRIQARCHLIDAN